MESTEKAIETAYQAQVISLYKALSLAISLAGDNQNDISEAENKFKKGLEFAADIRTRAMAAANT